MRRSINNAGLDLIKKFEGFYSEAYLCPAGVWTIGYGHTHAVQPSQTITEEEAEEVLISELLFIIPHQGILCSFHYRLY